MNKKLIASGIALVLCLTAIAPVYKSLTYNREILDPAKIQEAGTQANQDFTISESETMKAEDLAIKSMEATPASAMKATAATAGTQQAAEVKKSVPAAAPQKTTAAAAKKSTAVKSAAVKKSTTKAAKTTKAKPKTTVSRGTTTRTAAASSKASAVIATAKSYMGVPYVWGGESPSGFDCSGFTQYVLKKNGVSIPRVTADQFGAGVSVSKSNLRVGDLVFFTTYKQGPSHVGFYMGGGQFIHASSSKGVTISSLNSSYYSDRYVGARRVF